MLTNGDFYQDSGADFFNVNHPAKTKARAISPLEALGFRVNLQPLSESA